eukprot:TRINITY_DN3466_c0_g1_i1.p1 TRINITY_DN3466_c0_g1~~TRINITY_DN3466_c0_g1_i1.p1  ORF type:complete len:161 (-),score=23.74 TRINITY_DN3466_c0_g1_i1:379-831(-)
MYTYSQHKLLIIKALITITLVTDVYGTYIGYKDKPEHQYSINFDNAFYPSSSTAKSQLLENAVLHIMTDSSGQKYDCYIPKPPQEGDVEERRVPFIAEIRDVLHQSLSSHCVLRLAGWWTYEFCYGKHMKQFHQDKHETTEQSFFIGCRY